MSENTDAEYCYMFFSSKINACLREEMESNFGYLSKQIDSRTRQRSL